MAMLACCGLAYAASAQVTPNAGMLRFPDVSTDHICFVYANNIWIVSKTGGEARPIAGPAGVEFNPKFSPDGSTIAFVGNYDGNRDLYTIPIAGGVPERVTHHPAGESLSDWMPDGSSLLYITNGFAGLSRASELWTSPASGGMPSKMPVPYGGFGAVSPDGRWLAYTPHSTDTRTWKRYRGGMATDIWLFNLNDKSSRKITDWEGTDTIPMWVPGSDGSVVYYLSDNGPEHRLNIWSYAVAGGQREQVTSFADDDVRWPSIGPGAGRGEIVFQLGAKLMLLDLATKQSREVKVTIPGDRPKVRSRMVDAARYIDSASISPSGKRVAIEARGDLWSAPAKEGVVRALTRTDGVAERDPAWSPDNKWIAYFSDETGEYELWLRPADARPPEPKKDDAKEAKQDDNQKVKQDEKEQEGKADEKKDGANEGDPKPADDQPAADAKPADAKPADTKPADAPEPAREPRKLSDLGAGYRMGIRWAPDSKHLTFTDANGRLYLTNIEKGETKEFDKDPWMNQVIPSWSSDSTWIAYSKADEGTGNGCIWIAHVETGEKKRVTDPMFPASHPAFDRKGEFLFFASNRNISGPRYSELDTTFVYTDTDMLFMVPLREDVKNPWLPKSDEEELKEEKKKDDAKKDDRKDEPKKDDAKKDDEKKDDKPAGGNQDEAAPDDGVSGKWEGTAQGPAGSPIANGLPLTMVLKLDAGAVSGRIVSMMGSIELTGSFDKSGGKLELAGAFGGQPFTISGTISNGEFSGEWAFGAQSGSVKAKRAAAADGKDAKSGEPASGKKDEKAKEVKIDFDGFERRAMPLPVPPGSFGPLAVADGEKLIYNRGGGRDNASAGIKVFDYKADSPEEKAVTSGGDFQLSADGKKLLVFRGGLTIVDASAGGKSQSVPTDGMRRMLNPREEWKQIFTDAWRLQRDYFYEPTMHGVDWPRMKQHYGAMLDDAATREDDNWIIAEMISELNIGHAYLGAPGDVEDQPSIGVGMLGADFALDTAGPAPAYRITAIHKGGPWDSDARGPLSQPGVDVKVGDYLLAVNGIPLDTGKDPWAAFVGRAGQTVTLTVNAAPTMDGKQREVLVKLMSSEATLRYRAWIERNRAYVHEKSGGKIGYIYVPNTGVDGQNDLFRQFYGQRDRAALIIDERWNGGGQIPTRFIELLNRPVTNYWARRDGKDWTWPPDSHQGPKAMLANGLAGSGGDMFPWLFKHNKIGKVIGTRTWGGLVGISGNPSFIDGGSITVPTFGFYEADGTWGVEGHGVDPDIEVIDDPALMQNGADPQLDAAINHLLDELKANPYSPPARPASPNRKGMGLDPKDK